ncbi:MAG: hypothetical protein A2068_07565 [Ignavibacteria bacterium GWB2_35_6b]|nr:MAG: hypothetical protein A2068_07565 [Ignavibacteria bacterium GWB2_35_6b]
MKRKFLKIVYSLIIALAIVSCSSLKESVYKSDYPLSSERAKSISKSFSLQIPDGWFSTADNEKNSFELWLNNKDNSAAITFINIIADEKAVESDNELEKLLNYSKVVKKAELGKNYKELEYEEYFELNGTPCAALVFINKENKKGRIVVFEFDGHYYESTATVLNEEKISEKDLFVIQNSVLKTIY